MKRTIGQHKRMFSLLNQRGLGVEDRMILVRQYTKGRSSSTKDLFKSEADQLIKHLEGGNSKPQDSGNKMRRKVLYYFHQMGWEVNDGKINMKDVERWMLNKSYLNKSINDYTLQELPKLVSQVYSMYKKHLNEV